MNENKFCISKRSIGILFIFVFLLIFIFGINIIVKTRYLRNSKAVEASSTAYSSFNTDTEVKTVTTSSMFKKFKYNLFKGRLDRQNQYFFMAKIIAYIKPVSQSTSLSIINSLYSNFYYLNKTSSDAFNNLINKNYKLPKNISNLLFSTVLIEKTDCDSFWYWLFHIKSCYCQGLMTINPPWFCTSDAGLIPDPVAEAQKIALNNVYFGGPSIDPKLVKIVNDSFKIFNLLKTISALTGTGNTSDPGENLLGFDTSTLSSTERNDLIDTLVTQANSQQIPIEVEIGFGSGDFYNVCQENFLCLKFDLKADALSQYTVDPNANYGISYYFHDDFYSTAVHSADRIFLVSPYPHDPNPILNDPYLYNTNTVNLIKNSSTKIKVGGYVFVLLDPYYNADFSTPPPSGFDNEQILNKIRSDYAGNLDYTVDSFRLGKIPSQYKGMNIPWLSDPKSRFFDKMDTFFKDVWVLVIKRVE
ncbi:MAG: hypothetical protein UR68_C0017G0031 [Candidatus Roizmanbacteria bacterium GW2011_GWA2_35_19]|uniref:Uncharacterized protein n=2 Tax=Candidatus Roizmaniibacteriota TaxID=1752723 RepID=A0A0G0EAT0_9BACT|nr:MAG: hypothetical protein UR63_C0003G0030 [Candidatus Roizmanbacteria bacterium GW2011_GWC2_35_12]KKP72355.1 MAG: hypothetical protein UR68_C0017G0031 [Candidatus Roizmanbacteria bacterium GW2011_GWA2_35_19]